MRQSDAHGFRRGSVIVRSSRTSHNIHFRRESRNSTPVSWLGFGIRSAFHGFHFRKQGSIQSSLVGPQPFDLDVVGTPLGLYLSLLPGGDGSGQVQRASIAKVQSRPAIHAGAGYTR